MNFQADNSKSCPLCEKPKSASVSHHQLKTRNFWHCAHCDLIFVAAGDHVSQEAERNRYLKHDNSDENLQYQKFLNQLAAPVIEILKQTHPGGQPKNLDYGCGPSPVLYKLFESQNYQMKNYDPFFYPMNLESDEKWDVILSTEVWEHFRNPKLEIQKLIGLVSGQGILASMTQFHQGLEQFSNWWYPRDMTHVCFYSEATLKWIAERWQLRILKLENPTVIFQKT